MTIPELRAMCLKLRADRAASPVAYLCDDDISLHLPRGWKRPAGWPRGELLCDTETGQSWAFPIAKLLAWCDMVERAAA